MTQFQVLFVDDEEHLRIGASQSFELAGFEVTVCSTAADALSHLDAGFDGVVVSDIRMPEMDGTQLLDKIREIDPELPVIMVTGHGDIELAVSCIKNGAYDFIEKPWNTERLINCVRRAAEQRRLHLENRALRAQVADDTKQRQQLYGRSEAMAQVRTSIRAIASADVDVLITGETGTGKEVAARLLHAQSARSNGPFVHINCAALPDALIESELFGHEAGAFPGAVRARFGKMEHARGGTLCLDEVDLLPMPLQAKLLDVLHNRTLTRLGSNDPIALDMRVIAMSKSNLETAVAEQNFRSDLLYRLNVATLHLPPLSERQEDIPGLFTMLVASVAKQHDLDFPKVAPDMLSQLAALDWPGNVRELRNEAERYVLRLTQVSKSETMSNRTLADRMADYEKAQISAAIAANNGRLKETYESLGLSRKSLYDKMQRHGLQRSDFQEDR